ncbi:orotate phosphoribosyltransferase [Leptolyngbya sp. FACHB-261]|uniref:orotate phosphoribosyltransferase n=1 Tax=Leptolyngbya sp. FACHB-261 TaxID=2692806 RepID=UPI001682E132|nr:orotate phosphoribosyltransferase [Leptolyngbya sp. FACHB-261]MBD2099425.1 orotate phosphoribosyltransferase [Leptolyngbya sp. FACHB-261]
MFDLGFDLSTARAELLDLVVTRAYREGDFTLSSGQKSSYYVNCKEVTLHPQGALRTGQVLRSMLKPEAEAVAGLTLGADPIVTAVSVVSASSERPVSALIVRKEPKGHGTQAWIEGPQLPPGTQVAVLEDVVTTGQSALKAVERLRAAGYQVQQVLTLLDRLQGGAELYAAQGLQFAAAFTINDLQARVRQQAGQHS